MDPEELLRLARDALEKGATPGDVDRIIRQQTDGRVQGITQLSGFVEGQRSPSEKIDRDVSSFGRGVEDVTEGLMQGWLQLTNPDHAREFTDIVNTEREQEGPTSPLPRLAGQMLPLAPLALVPGGASTSLLTRLASGAVAGGAAGGTMFAPSGTLRERAFNTGVGAAFGAAGPEAVRAGSRAVASTAARAGGAPTDEALARQANYEALGIRPTTGQVTRNPRALAEERNLGQIAGVGDDIRAVRAGQAPQLAQALDEAVPGESLTQTEAGRRVMGTLGSRFDDEGIYREMGQRIDELYDAARNAPGVDDVLSAESFTSRISGTLDDFEDVIPGAVQRRIGELGDERAFTVGEALKLRQLLNARGRATNDPATGAAMSTIKRHLDDFLTEAGEEGIGEQALAMFGRANDAARRRARAFGGDLQKVVDDRVAPDDFVRRFVIGGNVDDIRQMRATLIRQGGERGRSAWDTSRRQVVDYLYDKAVNDAGNFSASRYNNALSRLGRDKLEVLFQPEELTQLERIGRAATDLFTDPPSGGIPVGNRSGTAAGNVANVPGMQWIERVSRSRAASRALRGEPLDRIGLSQRAMDLSNAFTNPRGTNPFGLGGGLAGLMQTRAILEGAGRGRR